MDKNSRTANSIKNITMGFAGQGITLGLGFISRMVFTRCLSADYLGVNGLFTNILGMLSLAELGIGTAIIYALYKPLATHDEEEIASLMHIYAMAYKIIGTVIVAVGIGLMPFLGFLIAEPPDIIEDIRIIYGIYLFNTGSSYFFSYKCSILTADQKNYIVTGINYIMTFVQTMVQILVLILTRNYIYFLLCQTVGTFIYNIIISYIASKRYPYIKKKKAIPLKSEKKKELIVNIKAVVIIKISGMLVNSTDNIIISAIKGLASTGIVSNYTLLSNTLNGILNQLFNGITASIGNLNAVEDNQKKVQFFNIINLLNFWLFGWCAVSFAVLANDIVKICFGVEYVMPIQIAIIMALNFYTVGMQNAVWIYKNTMGLFDYGKYLILITGIINIVLSIILGKRYGVFGILLATLISRMLTNIWYDPYAVFKYGLDLNPKIYFKKYLTYGMILIGIYMVTFFICRFNIANAKIAFLYKLIVCVIIPNLILILIFKREDEFQYIKNKVISLVLCDRRKCD